MNRRKELLFKMADCFADGMNPFDGWFLVENDVTLDEAMGMSEQIAAIIRGYLKCSNDTQNKIMVLGLSDADVITEELLNDTLIMKKLSKLNKSRP